MSHRRRAFHLEHLLVLTYWAVRLHNLLALPLFLDEGYYIYLAQQTRQIRYLFSGAADGRLFNLWWYAIFQPFANGDFVSRAAGLLLGALGAAALLALGRVLFSRPVGRAAVVVYILLPPAFFFERMALSDSLSAPLLTLLMWASVRLARKACKPGPTGGTPGGWRLGAILRQLRWPALCGTLLWALLLTKLSNLVFLLAPVLGGLAVGRRWAPRTLRRLAIAYGLTALALIPILAFLVFRLHSSLGLGISQNKLTLGEMPAQAAGNLSTLVEDAGLYLGGPLAGLVPILTLAALVTGGRPATLIVVSIALPLGTMTAVTRPAFYESRYYPPLMPGLALIIAVGIAGIGRAVAARWGKHLAELGIAVVCLLAVGSPLTFLWRAWQTPDRLALPPDDRAQYIEDFSSGFGWPEVRDFFRTHLGPEPVEVFVLDMGGWQRLNTYLFADSGVTVQRRRPGELPGALRQSLAARHPYLVVDEPYLSEQATDLRREFELEPVARFAKPDGRAAVVLYRVAGARP